MLLWLLLKLQSSRKQSILANDGREKTIVTIHNKVSRKYRVAARDENERVQGPILDMSCSKF